VTKKKLKFTGKNKFKFLTKFAIGEGKGGTFSVKGRLVSPFNNPGDEFKIDVMFFEDDRWEHTLNTDECVQKRQFKNFKSDMIIRGDAQWSQDYKQFALAKGRTRLWYVAIADCEGFTHLNTPSMPKIEIEIEILNGGSHFSEEEAGLPTINCILLVLLLCIFMKSTISFFHQFKREKSYESPLLILIVAASSDLFCVFLTVVHMFGQSYDGQGFYVLSIFSRLSYIFAQVCMVWMLLMIGYGWTISYKSVDEKDIYIIMMLFVLMVHMMITALTFVDDDEHHKYHDFSGVQGIIIVILRLILLSAFLYGAW